MSEDRWQSLLSYLMASGLIFWLGAALLTWNILRRIELAEQYIVRRIDRLEQRLMDMNARGNSEANR